VGEEPGDEDEGGERLSLFVGTGPGQKRRHLSAPRRSPSPVRTPRA
jgi:hypothetical protein